MSYTITLEPLGQSFQVEEGQTLLDAALRRGIYLPHACGHGLCGTCKVRVLDGEVEQGNASPFALMDMEREEGHCLACCATPESDLVIEADIDDEPDGRSILLRDFKGKVADLVNLTPTIKGVFIALEGDGIDFQAGQYVNLSWKGLAHPRAFSLASQPSASNLVELNIRYVPGGEATSHIHQQLQVGDEILVSGPHGRFFVRKSDPQPVVFMAGGSGLSSPRSMILDMLETDGDNRQITLIYGARNLAELYYHNEFLELAKRYPNFKYVPALSEPTAECHWEGFHGFVNDAAWQHFDGDFRGHKAYLCGPPPMIESCIRTLMKGRLFERDIYTEKFISAADANQSITRSPLFKNI
jgi:phenol/toluene 2-monooxygenase (NADH) P5/A5